VIQEFNALLGARFAKPIRTAALVGKSTKQKTDPRQGSSIGAASNETMEVEQAADSTSPAIDDD